MCPAAMAGAGRSGGAGDSKDATELVRQYLQTQDEPQLSDDIRTSLDLTSEAVRAILYVAHPSCYPQRAQRLATQSTSAQFCMLTSAQSCMLRRERALRRR